MVEIPKNPFILVDGSSYLFRAYHALPPLTTTQGQPTGAIYGVVNMLRKLIAEYQPTLMAVVFDSKEKNFRHGLFPDYKANRVVMPDELQQQIEPLQAIIKASGLPLVVIPGVEADDIIGTLAKEAKAQGLFTLISTGDKDFAQIVDDKTFLINTMSQTLYDREGVIQKFEVPPEKIIDYLALIGDSVDNIPGVAKVGPKTALKWLETYGSLDKIVQHADEIPGKVGENLREALDNLPLYRQLVTIDQNITLPFHPVELVVQKPDDTTLKALYAELEFKTWLRDLTGEKQKTPETETSKENTAGATEKSVLQKYDIILTEEQFNHWLAQLEKSVLFAFDTETNSLNYMNAEIVGVSFAIYPNSAAYVPLAHDYDGAPKQLSREWVLKKLKPLLEDPTRGKIGQNLKFDIEVLANYGIHLQGVRFDTMLESYILDSTAGRHDMDSLAERYLHYKTVSFEEIAGKGAKQITFNKIALDTAGFYAAEDADVTLKLHQVLWAKLSISPKQKSVFETIEMPLVPVLARMERLGVLIDAFVLKTQSEALAKRLMILEKEIHELAGQSFNISSPKQLQEILYTHLKLPILEKTPTGQPSTAESVLQELAQSYPLPKVILEYRSLSKLKSTYTDKLPAEIDPLSGRVHTSYHQAVTATGRLSSTEPNLQNIPIRSEEGRKIRSAFIAPPGKKIVSADYSQIELRIMAHMSQDEGLLQAFNQDDDIHKSTAAKVFDVALLDVTAEQRRRAKAINFGLMYGMSAFGLAKQLGIDRIDAEHHMAVYFACFPKVKSFMEHIRRAAEKEGYVETLFGRRLYLPDLKSHQGMRRKAAERAAVNAPMQGTNADLIKLAMIQLDQWIQQSKVPVQMIMQVHDELVFEIAEEFLQEGIVKIKGIMENIVPLSVMLRVGVGVGNNWDEAH